MWRSQTPRPLPRPMGNTYSVAFPLIFRFHPLIPCFRFQHIFAHFVCLHYSSLITHCLPKTSGSSDDLCYETGVNFEKESAVESQESPQSPVSPRTGQRVRRERTLSLSKSAKSATKTDTVLRTRQRTIYTSGRPPWYDTHGQSIECFVIGLSPNILFESYHRI